MRTGSSTTGRWAWRPRWAGRLGGDLTAGCAAALQAVLDALSGKAGPEDVRSLPQRRHDALEEACQRLIAAKMLPGLRGLPGASDLERKWSAARAAVTPGSVYLTGPDAEAAACDATVLPVVTGQIDWTVLDKLTDLLLAAAAHDHDAGPGGRPAGPDTGHPASPPAGRGTGGPLG